MKKDGPVVELNVYSFMTTTPNALTASINHERSPVLLSSDEQFKTWLIGTTEQAYTMSKPYPADAVWIVRRGREQRISTIQPTTSRRTTITN